MNSRGFCEPAPRRLSRIVNRKCEMLMVNAKLINIQNGRHFCRLATKLVCEYCLYQRITKVHTVVTRSQKKAKSATAADQRSVMQ